MEAQVIGEHGVSQVFLWSRARIAGVPIASFIEARGETLETVRRKIEQDVRYANITIIEGNDASQFGIGIVAARISEMVLRDERAVVPIGSYYDRLPGCDSPFLTIDACWASYSFAAGPSAVASRVGLARGLALAVPRLFIIDGANLASRKAAAPHAAINGDPVNEPAKIGDLLHRLVRVGSSLSL